MKAPVQLDLFVDLEAVTPVAVESVERWLAREAVTAEHLLRIAHGQVDAARSGLSASAAGCMAGPVSWFVGGGKVEYKHPDRGSGEVTVKALVALAAAERTDAKAERLKAAYRAYVDEVVDGRVPFPLNWAAEPEQVVAAQAHQARYGVVSAALRAASDGWWQL